MIPDSRKLFSITSIILSILCIALSLEVSRLKSELGSLKVAHLEQLAATEKAGQDRLLTAVALAESLQVRLHDTEDALRQSTERKQHEIVKVSSGRACFNADLVRVLNAADARSDTTTLPDSTAIADTGNEAVATDTDVALWIENAKEQYEVCRARHRALIDFTLKKPPVKIAHD